jgi:hypothetical protein
MSRSVVKQVTLTSPVAEIIMVDQQGRSRWCPSAAPWPTSTTQCLGHARQPTNACLTTSDADGFVELARRPVAAIQPVRPDQPRFNTLWAVSTLPVTTTRRPPAPRPPCPSRCRSPACSTPSGHQSNARTFVTAPPAHLARAGLTGQQRPALCAGHRAPTAGDHRDAKLGRRAVRLVARRVRRRPLAGLRARRPIGLLNFTIKARAILFGRHQPWCSSPPTTPAATGLVPAHAGPQASALFHHPRPGHRPSAEVHPPLT